MPRRVTLMPRFSSLLPAVMEFTAVGSKRVLYRTYVTSLPPFHFRVAHGQKAPYDLRGMGEIRWNKSTVKERNSGLHCSAMNSTKVGSHVSRLT